MVYRTRDAPLQVLPSLDMADESRAYRRHPRLVPNSAHHAHRLIHRPRHRSSQRPHPGPHASIPRQSHRPDRRQCPRSPPPTRLHLHRQRDSPTTAWVSAHRGAPTSSLAIDSSAGTIRHHSCTSSPPIPTCLQQSLNSRTTSEGAEYTDTPCTTSEGAGHTRNTSVCASYDGVCPRPRRRPYVDCCFSKVACPCTHHRSRQRTRRRTFSCSTSEGAYSSTSRRTIITYGG